MELPGEVGDVVLRHLGGMDMVLDGEVLGRQAEGVIPNRKQHVIAVHPLFPGNHIHSGVGPGMTHVQAGGGGVGELHQTVEFRLGGIAVLTSEGLFLRPAGLPFLFNGGEIVLQNYHALLLLLPLLREISISHNIIPKFPLNCKGLTGEKRQGNRPSAVHREGWVLFPGCAWIKGAGCIGTVKMNFTYILQKKYILTVQTVLY